MILLHFLITILASLTLFFAYFYTVSTHFWVQEYIIFVANAAVFWKYSGICGKYVFRSKDIDIIPPT